MIGFTELEDGFGPRLDGLFTFGADIFFLNESPSWFGSWLDVKAASMILLPSTHNQISGRMFGHDDGFVAIRANFFMRNLIHLRNDFGNVEARAMILLPTADNDVGGDVPAVFDGLVATRATLVGDDVVHADLMLRDVEARSVILPPAADDESICDLGVRNDGLRASRAGLSLVEIKYFGRRVLDHEA